MILVFRLLSFDILFCGLEKYIHKTQSKRGSNRIILVNVIDIDIDSDSDSDIGWCF